MRSISNIILIGQLQYNTNRTAVKPLLLTRPFLGFIVKRQLKNSNETHSASITVCL